MFLFGAIFKGPFYAAITVDTEKIYSGLKLPLINSIRFAFSVIRVYGLFEMILKWIALFNLDEFSGLCVVFCSCKFTELIIYYTQKNAILQLLVSLCGQMVVVRPLFEIILFFYHAFGNFKKIIFMREFCEIYDFFVSHYRLRIVIRHST